MLRKTICYYLLLHSILPEITRNCKTVICFCDAILARKVDSMPVLTHRLETAAARQMKFAVMGS
ncbi:MAG: hypothetical protein ACRCUY_03880 [Thermoguttaceae bacterium]